MINNVIFFTVFSLINFSLVLASGSSSSDTIDQATEEMALARNNDSCFFFLVKLSGYDSLRQPSSTNSKSFKQSYL